MKRAQLLCLQVLVMVVFLALWHIVTVFLPARYAPNVMPTASPSLVAPM